MKKSLYALFILLILIACQPVQTPTPAPTASQKPGPSQTSEASFTESVDDIVPTPNPTTPSTSTSTPLLILDKPLSATGPWVLVPSDKALFVINPDGTGYTLYINNLDGSVDNPNISINNIATYKNKIAWVEGDYLNNDPTTIVLKLRKVHDEEKVISFLAPNLNMPQPSGAHDDSLQAEEAFIKSKYQYYDTIKALGDLAWSPDGKYLAFTAAINGSTSDVYVFSEDTGTIKQLTNGPTQAVELRWTPDGRYIVHGAADSLNSMSSGYGYDMNSVWIVSPSGEEIRKLYDLKIWGVENIFGWFDNSRYIVGYDHALPPETFLLEIVDIKTGASSIVFDHSFESGAFDQKDHKFLLSVNNYSTSDEKYSNGLYLFKLDGTINKISDDVAWQIRWYPQINSFFAWVEMEQIISITPDGEIKKMPFLKSLPLISPNGKYWFAAEYGSEVGDWNGNILSSECGYIGVWSPDSQYLYCVGKGKIIVLKAPDFSVSRTIDLNIEYQNKYTLYPIWLAP